MVLQNILDYEIERKSLRFVKISFDTPSFNLITMDEAAKFMDIVGTIGGTMGLLTGFSIISAIELVYFALKISVNYFRNFLKT